MTGLGSAHAERMIRRFGPPARAWCDELDDLVGDVCVRWGLSPVAPMPPGGTSVVLMCVDGRDRDRVLKLTPEPRIAADEATALTAWAASPFMVDLIECDTERGVLLLESLQPSPRLSDSPWALEEVLPLLADLRTPVAAATLGSLRDRVDVIFDLAERRAPASQLRALFAAGRAAASSLAADWGDGLVHGDLHAGNVLRTARGQVAIDPRPCLGDRDVDLVDWALDGALDEHDLERRIVVLAESIDDVDAERLQAWCEAFAVVNAVSVLSRDADDPHGRFLLRVATRLAG